MGTSLLGIDDGIGWGVRGDSKTGVGMEAFSDNNAAIRTNSTSSNGVEATGGDAGVLAFGGNFGVKGNGTAIGVRGESAEGTAASFENTVNDNPNTVMKVHTYGTGTGIQVTTTSGNGIEVNTSQGIGQGGTAIYGNGVVVNTTGLFGKGIVITATDGNAIEATTVLGDGVVVNTTDGTGLVVNITGEGSAISANCAGESSGISVRTDSGEGISSFTNTGVAVAATSTSGTAIQAACEFGTAIQALSQFGISLLVQGLIRVSGNSVGQATLPKGKTSVAVNTSAATPTSNILLTPLDNPRGQLWVTRAADSFTIHTSAAPTNDVPIAYLIVN